MKQFTQWITRLSFAFVLIVTAGCSALTGNTSIALQASGIIEAERINVASELSGRVADVSVAEGQPVTVGAALITLDDSLLAAQRQAAEAVLTTAQKSVQSAQTALDSAQLQYDMTLSNALAAVQPNRTSDWKQTKPSMFDLPTWYYSSDEQYQSTQAALNAAKAALEKDQSNLESTEQKSGSAQFLNAEKRLSDARVAYTLNQNLLDQTNGLSSGQDLHNAAQTTLDDAKTELDSAQKAYDEALTTEGAKDVLSARARMAVSQERYDMARDALHSMQTGARAPEVTAASNAIEQAQAGVDQAQAQVAQAQANLNLLDAQIAKLTIRAPQDGVVLTRSVQPGEVLQAGMTALTIGKLDHLKVTVYLPEDRYGEVNLGEKAALALDSFPGQTFSAVVTRIADQAEFTPRNVQTKEQRQTTVYAVELSLDNPDGKLKPGMPVDVTFQP